MYCQDCARLFPLDWLTRASTSPLSKMSQTMLNFSTKRKPLADVDVNPRPPKREFKNVTASSSAVPEPPPEPSASVDTLHRLDDIAALVRLVQVQTKFSSLSIDSLQISAQPAPSPPGRLRRLSST